MALDLIAESQAARMARMERAQAAHAFEVERRLAAVRARNEARGAPWLAVQGQPRRAARMLGEAGFEAFVPMEEIRLLLRGARRRTQLVPLFGIYLFVRIDPAFQNWRAAEAVAGVARVMTRGEGEARAPIPAPPGFVEALIAHGPLSAADLARASRGRLRPAHWSPCIGEEVRLIDGPFAGAVALVSGLDGPHRARILQRIMGRLTPVSIPIERLVPASVSAVPPAGARPGRMSAA